MEQARDRFAVAREILDSGHPAAAASAAYYAMLNAARAALSERDEYAKTHTGTWTVFSRIFVATGEFDQELSALARRAKDARERGDYEAMSPTPEEAAEYVTGAGDFIIAIEQMLSA
ncbi:MAG TPA: HEPN domain-containing protein [Solirubrobacterales bacterium]|jgi:uncharacterized protein (UPF0332 family)|nr:HEPN domain-containing protein [Solirubrobacterales bacterium]